MFYCVCLPQTQNRRAVPVQWTHDAHTCTMDERRPRSGCLARAAQMQTRRMTDARLQRLGRKTDARLPRLGRKADAKWTRLGHGF